MDEGGGVDDVKRRDTVKLCDFVMLAVCGRRRRRRQWILGKTHFTRFNLFITRTRTTGEKVGICICAAPVLLFGTYVV